MHIHMYTWFTKYTSNIMHNIMYAHTRVIRYSLPSAALCFDCRMCITKRARREHFLCTYNAFIEFIFQIFLNIHVKNFRKSKRIYNLIYANLRIYFREFTVYLYSHQVMETILIWFEKKNLQHVLQLAVHASLI